MNDTQIGLRTQDIHEALKMTSAFGPKEVNFETSLLIGKAGSLAMHLKGLQYIEDYNQLKYAAASLQIRAGELPQVLRELEELDFVSVVSLGSTIKRVDVRVPEFRSGYSDLGARWRDLHPTEIEQAGIATIQSLHFRPQALDDVRANLGLDDVSFNIMSDVLTSGYLFRTQGIDGVRYAFSPLAFDEDPIAYLEWSSKFPTDVQGIIETLKANQGLAATSYLATGNSAMVAGIATGVFMPVQVNGPTGKQSFIFAPHGGLKPEEKTVLDKARAIVACVRYGQDFAQGRKIKFPSKLLEYLRDNKQFRYGNDEIPQQYGLLAEKLIAMPFRDGGGKFNLRFQDTEENLLAINTAIDMLDHGETQAVRTNLEVQRTLMSTSSYLDPLAARPVILSQIEASPSTSQEILRQYANIASLARGVSDI